MSIASHLALKEIWRNRSRFLLFSLVIALITLLILFVAALGEGLGAGNREYIEKLNAELLVYQDTAQLQIPSSQLPVTKLREVRNVAGVRSVGPIGFAAVFIPIGDAGDKLNVALIGVEPGLPGAPPAYEGSPLKRRSADECLIDETIAESLDLSPGDEVTIRTVQEGEEEYYTLRVVGITDSRKYGIRPGLFVPYVTWDRIRAQMMAFEGDAELRANVLAVALEDPAQAEQVTDLMLSEVRRIAVADLQTAYEKVPGYVEQQSTLTTQQTFALLIGLLVIGGFFQIQTLQKVPQIGMLKALGTPNGTIAAMIMIQILMVTLIGVIIGAAVTLALSLVFPPNIPIIFTPRSVALALATIMVIGPVGGLLSIRYALQVEPLTALGLSN